MRVAELGISVDYGLSSVTCVTVRSLGLLVLQLFTVDGGPSTSAKRSDFIVQNILTECLCVMKETRRLPRKRNSEFVKSNHITVGFGLIRSLSSVKTTLPPMK